MFYVKTNCDKCKCHDYSFFIDAFPNTLAALEPNCYLTPAPVHRVSIPKVEYTEEWYTTKSKCDQGERHHGLEKICHGSCEGVMAPNRCF